MAFRKKVDLLLAYKPDILVIPECEHPDKLKFNAGIPTPTDMLWFGSNPNKGLGIFSYSPFRLKVLKKHNPEFRLIIPIAVTGGKLDFTLYAIWAYNPMDPDGTYITQIWKALHYYGRSLSKGSHLLIGDFNSNTIWDKPRREGNHSNVVELLQKKGICSAYHRHFEQMQGKEQHPTLYMYRHKDKSYHIDYCFASEILLANLQSVEIGDYDSWKKYSDHVPVVISFNI
jgi:exonuclease III